MPGFHILWAAAESRAMGCDPPRCTDGRETLAWDWIGMSATKKRTPHINALPLGDQLGREIRRQVKIARTRQFGMPKPDDRPRGFVPRLAVMKEPGGDWAVYLDGEVFDTYPSKRDALTGENVIRRILCLTRW